MEILVHAIQQTFFYKGDCVWTSRGEYCLNGITRSKAIYLCEKNDINCYQKDFTFDEIKDCDEAFVTGTFAGIIPYLQLKIETYYQLILIH